MLRAAVTVMALLTATASQAAPVYLRCPVAASDGTSAATLEITLREDEGTADVLVLGGSMELKLPALFTATAVMFESKSIAGLVTSIHRSKLGVRQYRPDGTQFRSGVCAIQQNVERKF